MGRGWYAYTPFSVSSFATRKRSRDSGPRNSTGDEKRGAEEARVTEEFRNDRRSRRPVASLTDDALLRSRLQAQKDGTAVMDSKWLEIVDRCHRASLLLLSLFPCFLSFCLLFSSDRLYLVSSPARKTRAAREMHSLKDGSRRAWNFARFSSIFCTFKFSLTRTRP